jgi:hypothetical protein
MSNIEDHHPSRSNPPEASAGATPQSGLDQESVEETLRAYRQIPINERNWRRDAGFQLLPDSEKNHELIDEGVRDVRSLSLTIRHAVSKDTRQERLRDLLAEIDIELQKERYETM